MRIVKFGNDNKMTKCYQCDYATSVASHLKTHMRRHSVTCVINKYAPADSSTLKAHLRIHISINASSRAGSLRKHEKIYSGEKNEQI